MARMVPSVAVQMMKAMFPDLAPGKPPHGNYYINNAGKLRGVVELVKSIPEELLQLEPEQRAELITHLGRIEFQLESWVHLPNSTDYLTKENPVVKICEILGRCPDEYPPEATAELEFLLDADLRKSIRNDVGAATRALQNGEWKAATILAGAAIEALLHWKLSDPALAQQINTAIRKLSNQPSKKGLDHWVLGNFIDVAGELKLIEAATVIAANLARDYRNLIHPGKAKRQSLVCDAATAHSAFAGLLHVIRDLS